MRDASAPSGHWRRWTGASNAGRTFKGFEVFVAEQDGWGKPMTSMLLPFGKEV
jgi:hypothetical protein